MNSTIQRLINIKAPMKLKPGADQNSIMRYEDSVNISLPKEYQEWLLFSNGGEIFVPGTLLFGVGDSETHSLVEQNRDAARELFALNDSLLIVGRFNFGDLLCLDLRSGEAVQWDHELDEEFLRWPSFYQYLDEEITAFVGEGG